MQIVAGSSQVAFSWPFANFCTVSDSIWIVKGRSTAKTLCRRTGLSLKSSESRRTVRHLSAPSPVRYRNDRCWRQSSAAVSSGGKYGKGNAGGGNSKGNSERKANRKTKDNAWNLPPSPADKSESISNKKQNQKAKPKNVWSADFSSGKCALQEQASKSRKSSGDRAGPGGERGYKGRVNAVDDERGLRQQSSSAATLDAPASKRKQPDMDDTIFLRYLSPLLPIAEETELQPEEPIPNPLYSTFSSNASGVWRGVGATFSPITGEFEPIYLDEDKQDVYDVRVLTTVETQKTSEDGALLPLDKQSLHRKVLWSVDDHLESTVTAQDDDNGTGLAEGFGGLDELGYSEDDEGEDEGESIDWEFVLADLEEVDDRWEQGEEKEGIMEETDDTGVLLESGTDRKSMWEAEGMRPGASGSEEMAEEMAGMGLSDDEGFTEETTWIDVMEEDLMTWEPGLVFFEDGAYSRGPLELLTDASSSQEYFNADTFKVEQCLVAGGHRRVRIVHCVSVEGGEKIEILHTTVFEEEWMGPCNMKSISDVGGHQLKLFSERARHSPEDIVGNWKVFELEGTAIYSGQASSNEKVSFVFSCRESSIKRGFPEMPKLTVQEDESVDLSDFSMSWLTGNVSTYVNVGKTGALTFEFGWVCDNDTRLVMERAYAEDGKLIHVKSKSEIRKRL